MEKENTLTRVRKSQPTSPTKQNVSELDPYPFEGHTDIISGVTRLHDGNLLSWGFDGTVMLWSQDGRILEIPFKHDGPIDQVVQVSRNKFLSWTRSTHKQEAFLWSVADQSRTSLLNREILEEDFNEISAIVPLTERRFLIWSRLAKKMYIWIDGDIRMIQHFGKISGAIKLTNQRFVTWAQDKNIYMWSAERDPAPNTIRHEGPVDGIVGLANDRFVTWTSLSEDQTLRIWSSTGKSIGEIQRPHEENTWGVTALSDGSFVTWSSDSVLKVWGGNSRLIQKFDLPQSDILGVFQSEDGTILSLTITPVMVSCPDQWDPKVIIWRINPHLNLMTESEVSLATEELKDISKKEGMHSRDILQSNVEFVSKEALIYWDLNNLVLYSVFDSSCEHHSVSVPITTLRDVYDYLGSVIESPPLHSTLSAIEKDLEAYDLQYNVTSKGYRLIGKQNRQGNALLYSGDNEIRSVAHVKSGNFAAGDAVGNVHFLRPNRALRRLMGLSDEPESDA